MTDNELVQELADLLSAMQRLTRPSGALQTAEGVKTEAIVLVGRMRAFLTDPRVCVVFRQHIRFCPHLQDGYHCRECGKWVGSGKPGWQAKDADGGGFCKMHGDKLAGVLGFELVPCN